MHDIKVYKQSDGFTTEFEVRKDLGRMDWRDALDGLDIHYYKVLNEKVDTVSELEFYSPVYDGKSDLIAKRDPARFSSCCKHAV
jgi:hypothetical protein